MRPDQPILSIITPLHDGALKFAETVASLPDASRDIEWLIIHDGEKSPSKISGNTPIPEYARVLSGNGRGGTDAVNKGIGEAAGKYCIFLMSDDLIVADNLQKILRHLRSGTDIDLISVGVDFFDETKALNMPGKGSVPPFKLGQVLFGRPCLGARIFRKSLFDRFGSFDTGFTYCSDREFLGRLLFAGVSHTEQAIHLYRYRVHPGSETMGGDRARISRYLALHRNLAKKWAGLPSVTDNQKRQIFHWQDYETARLISYNLAQGALIKATGVALSQFVRRPLWPMSALAKRGHARIIAATDARLGP